MNTILDEAVAYDATASILNGQTLPSPAVHDHHRHDHELQLTKCDNLRNCHGCKRPASGSVYLCEPCDFTLHIHCMFPKENPKHDFYPNCTFEFLKELPDKCRTKNCECKKRCSACTREADGYVYCCKDKGILLHPCCFNLPIKLPPIEGVEFELSSKDGPLSKKCIWCKKQWLDGAVTGYAWWFYKSTCENNYHFHAYCSIKMLHEAWQKANPSVNHSLVPKNLNLPNKRELKSKEKSDNKLFKIVKTLFKILVSVLIGDPTTFFASLAVDLVMN